MLKDLHPASGFMGVFCSTQFNHCVPNPCTNGGTCQTAVNTYTCTCPSDYVGSICESDIDTCRSSPCHNNGTCVNGVGSFSSECSTTGYSGPTCNIPLNGTIPCNSGYIMLANYTCQPSPAQDIIHPVPPSLPILQVPPPTPPLPQVHQCAHPVKAGLTALLRQPSLALHAMVAIVCWGAW